jgi:hypothetical protein
MKVQILKEAGYEEKRRFEYLKTRVVYDQHTGKMYWLPKQGTERYIRAFNSRYAGKEITSVSGNGYMQIRFCENGVPQHVVFHRLAFYLGTGAMPEYDVDHINGNKTDNRLCNLRDATRSKNMRNAKQRVDNASGSTGVYQNKHGSFIAQGVDDSGTRVHLGCFLDLETAASVASTYRKEHGYSERHLCK